MKTILVATDFSPAAVNATNYAANMALATGADLLLFHAYQVPIAVTDVPLVLMSVEDLQKSADHKLAHLKADVEHITSGKLTIRTEARLGHITDELENVCNDIRPLAVIMGTTGHSSIDRLLFGSTTLTAIRQLTSPVICVPRGREYGSGIKKIGFACDLRQVEETTPFTAIIHFVQALQAELHVLNVEEEGQPDVTEQTALLGTALKDTNPQFHFIRHSDIEDGINDFAETNNLDLLIAIPKKHKLLDGLFKPSSTRQLVKGSHIPVMCIHE
ncbi:MAG: universal stress protein [Chitinophagaceae bacterium]